MRETRKVLITVLLVGLSMITVAAADRTMSVSQQPADAGLNETFIAEVTVNPAGGVIYAASYDLYFNATILEAIEQTQGDFLSQGDVETLDVVNEINNTIGKIQYGEIRLGSEETVGYATELGVLASITFKVIGEGVSTLTLSNVKFDPTSEQTNDDGDDESPDTDEPSHSSSGGPSGYTPITTTPTATPTETVSATSTGDDSSSAVGDNSTIYATSEGATVSVPAESAPTATPTKKPSRPKSAIPGFAAMFTIAGLVIVACIIKRRRGE